jgi:hypothetical protein
MLLAVIDIKSESDSDSDYDTAVDIRHWSMHRYSVLFESPGGVRFMVDSTWENTTHSYMEPDFDHMEKTGETVWLTHDMPAYEDSEASDNDKTQYRFDGLYIARPTQGVSVAEFQEVLRGNEGDLEPWDIYYDESRAQELNLRVAAHLAGGDGRPMKAESLFAGDVLVEPNRVGAAIERDEIARLSRLDVKKGRSYEIELSTAFEASILAAEKLNATVVADNYVIKSENRVHAAQARIENVIDEMAKSAMAEMKQSYAAVRP